MGNELFQARLPDDFADRIHEYREENHMTKSEAIRHLIRTGLEAETEEEKERDRPFLEQLADGSIFTTGLFLGAIGLALIVAAAVLLGTVGLAAAITIGATGQLVAGAGAVILLVNFAASRATNPPESTRTHGEATNE